MESTLREYKSLRKRFCRQCLATQTDRHTYTQTKAGENIFPRFCGDNNVNASHK